MLAGSQDALRYKVNIQSKSDEMIWTSSEPNYVYPVYLI